MAMTEHQARALNAFMNNHDFTHVTIGESPFTVDRKRFAFAPPDAGNVYTFPVPDAKQENDEMAEEKVPAANAYKGGRYERVYLRATSEEKQLLEEMCGKRKFKSLTDYIMALVEKDAKDK